MTTLIFSESPTDFEDAFSETGHGRFQYKLMALCGFIYACCSLSTTTLSYVLPAAQFDFKLSSVDKGLLNTAPVWGMVAGAYIWGNFADRKGRRFVLLYSLLIDACAAFLSSFCQHFFLFFICRIFNGFAIIGSTSMVFAYLGEFINTQKRDHYLSRLELFWTFGIILLPVIGFAILPRNWVFGDKDVFVYNSWRIFVFVCGLPSLLAALLISRMPESPRFLLLQGNEEHSRQVLVRMFVSNTKNAPHEYPVKSLSEGNEKQVYHFSKSSEPIGYWDRLKNLCTGLVRQHKDLACGQSLVNILLTSFIDFGLMSVYYSVTLWVPELLYRQEQFILKNPGESASLCKSAQVKLDDFNNGKVDNSLFVHTFIICLACLPANILLLFLIKYIRKKTLIMIVMVIAAVPTAVVYFMDTPVKVTVMLCFFEALTTLVEAVLFCIIVEIFPLGTRGTALSLTVTVGRLGAVLGNIGFGLMIDNYCAELFFTMSGMLVLSGIAALFLPKTKKGH